MFKIKLKKISDKAKNDKGFGDTAFSSCYFCPCGKDKLGGSCCRYGCEIDKESFDLIIQNKDKIEPLINRKLEDCFDGSFVTDEEYLGGSYIESKVRKEDGYCVFHEINGRGCVLAKLVIETKLPRRMIPTICRLYPLTWENGEIKVYDELEDYSIEIGCNCVDPKNDTKKTLIDTQKEEIEDIFEIPAGIL